MKKTISILLLLYLPLVFSQENKVDSFSIGLLESTKVEALDKNENHKVILKQQITEFQKQLKTFDDLQNKIPKITFSKQHFFYTRNDFMGVYNLYNSVNGEVQLYQSYFHYNDFMPTCFMSGPLSNGDAGDFVGAIIKSILSDMDLKLKVGKRHTFTFF